MLVIAVFASFTLFAIEIAVTQTLSRFEVAYIVDRAHFITFARFALGQTIVTLGANLTEITTEIRFTRTFSIVRFAIVSICSVQIALACPTIRIAEVTVRTRLT